MNDVPVVPFIFTQVPFESTYNTSLKDPVPVVLPVVYVTVVALYILICKIALELSVPASLRPSQNILHVFCSAQAQVEERASFMVLDSSVTVAELILQVSVSVVVYVILYIVLLVQFVLPEASFVHI